MNGQRRFGARSRGKWESMSSSPGTVPTVTLRGDVEIPQLGFGVWEVPAEETATVVTHAFDAGYRHIDTASIYGNEAGVGHAIHASGLPRDEVFVTTKCFNDEQGRDKSRRAFERSLERLGLDRVDLYLIHWPVPSTDLYVETWQTFIELQQEGLTRAIGVSNFQPAHLERLEAETGVQAALNQVELHPRFQQAGLRRDHAERGVVTESWSPLGKGVSFGEPAIAGAAEAHGVSPAQVVLRWHLQLGNVVIPRSVRPERIRSNFDVFSFHLTPAEMEAIAALDAGDRTGPDPDVYVR